MSEDVLIEQFDTEMSSAVTALLIEIHAAEEASARAKMALVAMGFESKQVQSAVEERNHTKECIAGAMLGKWFCNCPKPTEASTEEVF